MMIRFNSYVLVSENRSDQSAPEAYSAIHDLVEEQNDRSKWTSDKSRDENATEHESETDPEDTEMVSDPIRIYLMQMGNLPMLNREEEEKAANKIERSRNKFCDCLLSSDYLLRKICRLLRQVLNGKQRLDRTVDISVSDLSQKLRLSRVIEVHAETLEKILARNQEDFRRLVSRTPSKEGGAEKKAIAKQLTQRRRRAVRLVREIQLRMNLLTPYFKKLQKIEATMTQLRIKISHLKIALENDRGEAYTALSGQLAVCRKKLRQWERRILETPNTLRRYVNRSEHLRSVYEKAKSEFSAGNLRLVVAIAKKYRNRGLGFLDLIQEGNTGLMKAVDKFEKQRGFKFSTYATWWIRQAISRAIADNSRTIRVPVHMLETLNRIRRVSREIQYRTGMPPTLEETAESCHLSCEELAQIMRIDHKPVSLDQPVGTLEENSFGDFLEDDRQKTPENELNQASLRSRINEVLQALTVREREIIKLRFGLADGSVYTLEEVGKIFSVTRERVRQIEAKAVRKLQHPIRSRRLSSFVDLPTN